MSLLLRAGRRTSALRAMLLWSFLVGATTTVLSIGWPDRASQVVIHGPEYWREMSVWLETGQGIEGRPAQFIPQHLRDTGLFVVFSLVTGSLVSILFGTILLSYMSYYVARLVLVSGSHPLLAGLLGWHPWSLLRIASFIVFGVYLAEPVLSRVQGRARPIGSGWKWIALGLAGLVLDAGLKAAFAPRWRELLLLLR